jgi:hypothetical protein
MSAVAEELSGEELEAGAQLFGRATGAQGLTRERDLHHGLRRPGRR